MKNLLACADFTFPLLAHEKALQAIALLELEGVDIGLFAKGSHLSPRQELEKPAEAGRELARQVAANGLRVSDVFLTPGEDFISLAPNHPEANERRRSREIFERALEYTVASGSLHMSALPGVTAENEAEAQAAFARCEEEMAWRLEKAQAAGVVFSVEPHIGSVLSTPALAAALVRQVPGLTLTLDYGHFIRSGVPQEEIDPLVAWASHFHARCACQGRLQSSFKASAIDFRRVLRLMRECGYAGALGLEYVWIDWEHCNEVDNLSETVLLRDFLRLCMEEE
jgi:sugar phosphate isomerase/epimerase